MKNGKALHKIIGCGVVLLAVFVFAGTGYSRTPCGCQKCEQPQHPAPPVVEGHIELQYRDGFPGYRRHKRQQVRKLQCMLKVLGYCSGPIDGWYGKSTARGVMLFLADNFNVIGYGKMITKNQWNHLVSWAGDRCTKYNKKPKPYRPYYPAPRYQEQQYQGHQYQSQQYYEYKY
ncbi:MAG: peptidoglycan-binding protein [Candidatus Electrothrix sp. ATG1]|nr:peptidoglycan-binding protein [Candidatus Electrothrix sp. ATG1]